jgi:hypothetical protein
LERINTSFPQQTGRNDPRWQQRITSIDIHETGKHPVAIGKTVENFNFIRFPIFSRVCEVQ